MNKCLNCESSTKNSKFCNRSCSATYNNKNRILSDETKNKISKSLSNSTNKNLQTSENIKKMKDGHDKWKEIQLQKLLTDEFSSLGYDRQRKRIIIEQENKCNHCNLSEWMGKSIPLEIDHVDGINDNNVRDNMEALCPNCHALTDTWRGRNRSDKKQKRISDQELVDKYIECGNIRKTLLSFGMAAKGNNYGRVKRALSIRKINY